MNLWGAAPVPATKAAQPTGDPCCVAGCTGAGGSDRSSCRSLLPLAARQLYLQPANWKEGFQIGKEGSKMVSSPHGKRAHGRCAHGQALAPPVHCGLQPLITACSTGGIGTQGCRFLPCDGAPAMTLGTSTAGGCSTHSCCNAGGQPCRGQLRCRCWACCRPCRHRAACTCCATSSARDRCCLLHSLHRRPVMVLLHLLLRQAEGGQRARLGPVDCCRLWRPSWAVCCLPHRLILSVA